jgi:segregation and condensation protein A
METLPQSFAIKTEIFEGPLELLLRLVEDRKLPINDISLSDITETYMHHIQSLELPSYVTITSFLSVASTLMLIKAKSLLPFLKLTEDEEQDIDELKRRLIIYQHIQSLIPNIENQFGKTPSYHPRHTIDVGPTFAPHSSITVQSLLESIQTIIQHIPKPDTKETAQLKKAINLKEILENLTQRIQDGMQTSFQSFTKHSDTEDTKSHKVFVVVSFLALLELVKDGIIQAIQSNHFQDITISQKQETDFVSETKI